MGISLAIVLVVLSGPATAAHSGSLVADPVGSGELATHTMTVTVEQASAGQWSGIALDYSASGANPAQVGAAGIGTLGIDRGDDAPGDAVDVDAAGDIESIVAENTGTLEIRLGGAHDLQAGDEIVLRVVRSIQNPASAGDYDVPIDVNPGAPGGETTAKLQIGADRATVLVDDQSVTGTTVHVKSVRLPKGGFVVLHDMEALDNGANNADAVTGASVVGVSSYQSAGLHEEVTVSVDADIDGTATYAAMVTKDDGDEEFDAEVDRPYTVGGNPIWESASVTFQEPTATPTPEETATPAPETATPTDTATAAADASTSTPASGPGFGGALAVISLLSSVVALRRRGGP
jgi:PGF-CTERM protein